MIHENAEATNVSAADLISSLGEAILSTTSDAIIAADRDGKIFFWNPGAARIFGRSAGECIGQSLDIMIPERLRERHWIGYKHVMKSGESRYGQGDILAVPALVKDGREISVEFTIIPLRDKAGELAGLATIMRDVTKRYQETRELKQKLAKIMAQ
jgi:PAS domain S-box-containing protein